VLGELALRRRDKLTLILSDPIVALGLWAEQLVAESTGKRGRGIVPVADEPAAIPAPTATTACSSTWATRAGPTQSTSGSSRSWRRTADRP
jgi:hypothetical protein